MKTYFASLNGSSHDGLSPRRRLLFLLALVVFAVSPPSRVAGHKTENVFLIISDGLRWQEVFGGAEALLMTSKTGGVKDTNGLQASYWRSTPEARREALLPFVWTQMARRGQLFGNQHKRSVVTVTNRKNFSYPGYNEILTGAPDDRIDSNAKKPNPNTTVFEWLNGRPALRHRVALFATWDVFPYIFNVERSRLPIWPAWEQSFLPYEIAPPALIADLAHDTTQIFEGVAYDSFLFHAAMDYLKRKRPGLVFMGFGETDEWAHAGRYDQYLTAAHHVDDFVRRLWEWTQSIPDYRDKTTFIISADHGRGTGPTEWKDHGAKIDGSEGIWIAVIGPDTPALGERTGTERHTQSQIASTIAALLGEDFRAAFPNAGSPIADILGLDSKAATRQQP